MRPRDHADAARIAVTWLAERHRKGWKNAVEALLDHWRGDDADLSEPGMLDEAVIQMIDLNAGEWLLARGEINARGAERNINEYLLAPGGARLTPGQRSWIAQLRERPLRLYRVTDVLRGEGLTVVDELDAAAAPVHVHERSGSQSAYPGLLMGARIMHVDSGAQLSGAVYTFAALREAAVLDHVAAAMDAGLHPQNNLALAEWAIANAWLAQSCEPSASAAARPAR